jgi:poly(glycerol-phosphate) alpha-glucosyltransferase
MVQELIDELGIAERVLFKGFTKNIDEIYDGAVATIFTSASEGLGLALLESMSYRVPVVAYDSNYGPRDVISDGANGYLVPFGDYHAAADRILELMANSELRAQLGLAARDSLKSFDLSSYLKGWTDVVEGRNR